jgi:DNA modification methylase
LLSRLGDALLMTELYNSDEGGQAVRGFPTAYGAQTIGEGRLIQGDCLELMKEVETQSVDLVLCDLPYGTTQNKWDSVLPLDTLWAEYKRICRGAIVLTAQTPFDKILGASNLKMLRYEWIWEKTAATGFLNAKKSPLKAHENILVFYEKQPTYNPIMVDGPLIKRANPSYAGHGTNYGKSSSVRAPYESSSRYPRSVVKMPRDNRLKAIHPTQKPVGLMEYMIKTYTNSGDVVMDNCMGSGTTGVACINTGRKFIGMEKDPDLFIAASSRLRQALDGGS